MTPINTALALRFNELLRAAPPKDFELEELLYLAGETRVALGLPPCAKHLDVEVAANCAIDALLAPFSCLSRNNPKWEVNCVGKLLLSNFYTC